MMYRSIPKNLLILAGLLVAISLLPAQAEDTKIVATGTFVGQSDHITTGAVTITQSATGIVVELGDDFSLDGAPDPKLGFGKNGYDADSTFSPLRSKAGGQVYQVPGTVDISKYDEIYVWCEKFDVPLGVAKLAR